jgi:hypothetical protein
MSPRMPLFSLGPKYTFPLTPICEDTKGCRSHYCHASCSVSLTWIHLESPHISTYIILLYIKTQKKHPYKDLLFVRIRISLIYLHLVLSTPCDMDKQDIRHNIITKAMNIMMCFQSTTNYKGSNIMVNA